VAVNKKFIVKNGLVAPNAEISGDLSVDGSLTVTEIVLGNNSLSDISTSTTDDLTEGNTNLYWIEAPSDGQQYVRQDADWVTVDIPEGYGDSEVITLLDGNVNTNITPSLDITYDLGTANNRWRDLYLSGNTINLGDAQIKADESSGTVSIIPPVSSGNPNPRAMVFNSQGHMRSVDTTGGVLQSNALSQSANVGATTFDSMIGDNLTVESNLTLPVGNTDQRPANSEVGMIRYNSELETFEGFSANTWGSIGGGGATGGGDDEIFIENGQTITEDYTIPVGKNALTTGPVEVNANVSVTISDGSRWVVL